MQESERQRRGFLRKAGLTLSSCTLIACTSTNYGDDLYRLQLASAGKDVMWMPSSRAISMAMLEAFRHDELEHRDDALDKLGATRPGFMFRLWCSLVGQGSAMAVRLAKWV